MVRSEMSGHEVKRAFLANCAQFCMIAYVRSSLPLHHTTHPRKTSLPTRPLIESSMVHAPMMGAPAVLCLNVRWPS